MLPPSNGKMRRMGKKQQMRRQIASMAVGKENSAITIATGRTIEITKKTNKQMARRPTGRVSYPYERNNAPFDLHHPKQTGWF